MIIIAVLANKGALLSGAAGVGKSKILRGLKLLLEFMGQKVITNAYTHAATRLVGGSTIASLLHMNTSLCDTWFLIDEVGLIPLSTLGAMSRYAALGAHFVFFLSLIHI